MTIARGMSSALLLAALVAGTFADTPRTRRPLMAGGYRVLSADFHIHPFPLSWSGMAPWDLVLEAPRQGLDVIAVTGHNEAWSGRAARWFSQLVPGTTVLAGEEIHPPRGHILAIGIQRTIDWTLGQERAVDEIHQQGGVAIAAHPSASSWPLWSDAAMRKLDGVEAVHPAGFLEPQLGREFADFYLRTQAAAVADTDFHGLGPLGLCRTFVLARDNSEAAVLEALRARRTVVIGLNGQLLGDPKFFELADWKQLSVPPPVGILDAVSRVCAVLGLLLWLLFTGRTRDRMRPREEVRQDS
jgi:hypothetical protein